MPNEFPASIKADYISFLGSNDWLIDPKFAGILRDRVKLITNEINDQAATWTAPSNYGYEVKDGTAIINVRGALVKNPTFWSEFFGDPAMSVIENDLNKALDDKKVRNVLFVFDTPGGTVAGTKELSDAIYDAREKKIKPINGFSDGNMLSAGYYIGSAVEEIFAFDTSYVGSIGVVRLHVNQKKMLDDYGIEISLIYAGKYKVTGHPFDALSDADREIMQSEVDKQYSLFIDSVARNRGETDKAVREKMADGKIFIAKDAVENGLIDGVGKLREVVAYVNLDEGLKNSLNFKTQSERRLDKMGLFGNKEITVELLQADAPEIYQSIIDQGKADGKTEAETAGAAAQEIAIQAATKAERDRAEGIFKLVEGNEALYKNAADLFAAGKSIADSAVEITAALNKQVKENAAAANFDGSAAAMVPAGGDESKGDQSGVVQDQDKFWSDNKDVQSGYQRVGMSRKDCGDHLDRWNKDAKVRSEFGGDVKIFLAHARHNKE